jgi:hypothetical protein
MHRRSLLAGLAGIAGGGVAPAPQEVGCYPSGDPRFQICEAGAPATLAMIFSNRQRAQNWCWAACIEMIFATHGRYVPQEQIVIETWGSLRDAPAYAHEIRGALNRAWRQPNGRTFQSSSDERSVTPVAMAQDLAQGWPLIIGVPGHAMVMSLVRYYRDRYGNGRIYDAGLMDPARGVRNMPPGEFATINLAIRVRTFGGW